LPNLETAQKEKSVLLLDEQNLLAKEEKEGCACIEYQNGFMSFKTDSCKA
jgi:hypothetical protein